jgi:hypothetical protein
MVKEGVFNQRGLRTPARLSASSSGLEARLSTSRKVIVGLILVVALFAFELFNFDTTRYALDYLLGEVNFWGMRWATILAIAFCAIDFAGLARLFTPEEGDDEPRAVWYLMGAWLLGATMNALMTWWAVSLTLLSHDFGNEVLSREQLLQIVPIFVATLVWLTRILFIGALSVAGEHLFEGANEESAVKETAAGARKPAPRRQSGTPARPRPVPPSGGRPGKAPLPAMTRSRRQSRIPAHRPQPVGMQARGRRR